MIRNFADHAANERTFLAWVRTAVAIVGFGIAGARLGPGAAGGADGVDALVLGAGALVVLLAWLRMSLVRRRIDSARPEEDAAGRVDLMLALLVAAFFALLATFALRLSL